MSVEHESHASGRIGMWLFISTEILLFGGLFLLYSIYRLKNPIAFHDASLHLNRFLGTINTCILITSSLSSVLAINSLKENRTKQSFNYLLATIAFASIFLIVKGLEWGEKIAHGLFPNSPVLLAKPPGEILYFGLYYSMTGLHALHLIVGIILLLVIALRIRKGSIAPQKPILAENAALYWHLVDIIWLFLFPLFYLIS